MSERWANPEEITNVPVCPWDRPEHRQEAGVRPMGARRERKHELDEAPFPKPPAGAGPSERVYLKQSDFDARGLTGEGCPVCRAIREGMRAQGHSAVSRARIEELLQATAKGQQRLQEAERRARDTAGERAAKRIKYQFAEVRPDRSREPHQCKSQRRHCRGRCCKCEQCRCRGCRSRCWQRGRRWCRSRCSSRHRDVRRGFMNAEPVLVREDDEGSVKCGENQ